MFFLTFLIGIPNCLRRTLFKNRKIKLYDSIYPYFYHNALLCVYMEFIIFNLISYSFHEFYRSQTARADALTWSKMFLQIFFSCQTMVFYWKCVLTTCTYDRYKTHDQWSRQKKKGKIKINVYVEKTVGVLVLENSRCTVSHKTDVKTWIH